MEKDNFKPAEMERKNSNFNMSENNSCENVVNVGSDSIIHYGFKRSTVFENENAAEKLKEESTIGISLFKKSEKNITESIQPNSNQDQEEIEKKENENQSTKENIDPNALNNSLKIENQKAKIIPAYGNTEKCSHAAKEQIKLHETIAANNNDDINNKISITAENKSSSLSSSNNQSERIHDPKTPSKVNITKPNENTSEKRINIFKKTDITQGSSYDFIFKIALIGDSAIGKTSILIRFVDDVFKNDTTSTIGVDFKLVSFRIEDKLAKMQIWDTCGSERFKSLTSSFIKSCSVFVLVFDLTKQKSFLNLESWIKLIKENVNPKLLCLVGNKADLEDQRQVTLEDAIKFSNKHELKYMETSARTNFGIESLFSYIAEKLYDDTIKMRNLERESRKSKSNKKNSKAFELGPSANIVNKEDEERKKNKSNNSESDDDEVYGGQKKSGKKIINGKNGDYDKRRTCNC